MGDSGGENGNGAFGVAICKGANIWKAVVFKEQNKEPSEQLSQTPILSVFETDISGKKKGGGGENGMYFYHFPVNGSIKIVYEWWFV